MGYEMVKNGRTGMLLWTTHFLPSTAQNQPAPTSLPSLHNTKLCIFTQLQQPYNINYKNSMSSDDPPLSSDEEEEENNLANSSSSEEETLEQFINDDSKVPPADKQHFKITLCFAYIEDFQLTLLLSITVNSIK